MSTRRFPSTHDVLEPPKTDPNLAQAWWGALNAPDGPNVRRLRTLVKHGFDVDAAWGRQGQTALHHAAQTSNPDLVELLLGLGADPSRYRANGMAVLHDAAGILRYADVPHACAIIDRLLDHGVPVDQPIGPGGVAHGASALWLATYNRQAALVHHLIQRGADPCRMNTAGISARTIAQEQGCEDILNMLIKAEQQALVRTIDDLPAVHRDRPRL